VLVEETALNFYNLYRGAADKSRGQREGDREEEEELEIEEERDRDGEGWRWGMLQETLFSYSQSQQARVEGLRSLFQVDSTSLLESLIHGNTYELV